MTFQCWLPIVRSADGKQWVTVPASLSEAKALGVSFSELSRTFSNMVRQLQGLTDEVLLPAMKPRRVKAPYLMGGPEHAMGLPRRQQLYSLTRGRLSNLLRDV